MRLYQLENSNSNKMLSFLEEFQSLYDLSALLDVQVDRSRVEVAKMISDQEVDYEIEV